MKRLRLTVIWTVAGAALLEMRSRKDPAVLVMLLAFQLVLLLAARFLGFDTPAAGTFLLNLNLTLAVGVALLMTLLTTARQMPEEAERRTIYPLLARPVGRAEVLLGKWMAGTIVGWLGTLVLVLPPLLLIPRLEQYAGGTLVQLLVLQMAAVEMSAALALLCTLLLPLWPGLLTTGLLTFGTGALLIVSRRFFLVFLLPDPGRLNLVLRYTDGIGPLAVWDFILLLVYGGLWTLVLLAWSMAVFEKREI